MNGSLKHYDVIIAGAGPAGTSAAIHLAKNNLRVLLVEKKTFPRIKLCGEFISPECIDHFEELGVALDMETSGPAAISETIFYSHRGKRFAVPSRWFGGTVALGLSRYTMDDNLLRRARSLGVDVWEQSLATDLIKSADGVAGLKIKTPIAEYECAARVLIDATGRSGVLVRKISSSNRQRAKPRLVAFKTHVNGARGARNACEIYSYPGGYGGLSSVENGLSNLCFIVDAHEVINAHSDPEAVVRENVMRNPRAAFTLEPATFKTGWLSVALESFGRQRASPVNGLLAIGDSAAFIDPFTGSGMLMAFESGKLVADVIVRHQNKLHELAGIEAISSDYDREYREKFNPRLRVCSFLRRVAYKPRLAQFAITICGANEMFRNWLARATRSNIKGNTASPRLG